jgi:hypothetical protein
LLFRKLTIFIRNIIFNGEIEIMKYTNSNQWYQEYGKEVMDKNEFSEFEKYLNNRRQNGSHTLDEWENLYDDFLKDSKKSMKESINGDCYIYYDDDDNKRLVFCDYVKGITDTSDWFYLNEYIIDAIHIFKNEKQAQKFIDEHLKYFADQDKVVIAEYPQTVSGFFESKESVRKLIKESADDNWYKLKMLNEMLDAMEEDEYNIPKLGIYGVTKNINLDKGAIEALIKYYK